MQSLIGERIAQGLLPIGRNSLHLTNAEGGVLPTGAFGEICTQDIVGKSIRTGTMARSSSTGVIELLDQNERFVQLRGHRVCLGDIEDAAFALPSIRAASVAVTATDTDARLAVYLVAAPEQQDAGALRQHFHLTLPSHLVPSDYIWLDSLPISADGRLDARRLPKYEQSIPSSSVEASSLPLNEVEQKLAAIWKDVLGLKSLDIRRSFFELGGSSLLLVRLFARINKAFSTSLPITTIFDAQTIAALAVMLGGGAEISHLVQVQSRGSKPPLFMIHSYLLYQGLSMSLGTDQPFYGLRELEQDGHLSIEERVKRYVAEIQRLQPRGPYHLAGWCAAGPLTVEVARQLLQSGEEISYLGLFDSWLPGYLDSIEHAETPESRRYKTVGSKLRYHRYRLRGLGWWKKALYTWMLVARRTRETRYRFYLRNWERLYGLSKKYQFSLPQFMHNTSFETFSALKNYHGQRVPLRLTLIRASDSREVPGAVASCGWEQIAEKGVDVLWAPGDHETMFIGEHLKVTSEMVRHGLEAAAGSVRASNTEENQQDADQILGVLHVDCPSS
jgi:thioesterase domain-containing protein/acyl carrier protein